MSRADAKVVVNSFQGGLVTEASAINSPEGSMSEALNVRLLRDGSVMKRPGLESRAQTDLIDGGLLSNPMPRGGFQVFFWPQQGAHIIRSGSNLMYRKVDKTTGGTTRIQDSLGDVALPNGPVSIAFSKNTVYIAGSWGSGISILTKVLCNFDDNGDFVSFGQPDTLEPKIRDFDGFPNFDKDGNISLPHERIDAMPPYATLGDNALTRFQQYNLFNAGWPSETDTVVATNANGSGTRNGNPIMDALGWFMNGSAPTTTVDPRYIPALGDAFHMGKAASADSAAGVGAFNRHEILKNAPSGKYSGKHIVSLFNLQSSREGFDKTFTGIPITNGNPTAYSYAQQAAWDAYDVGTVRTRGTAVGFAHGRLWVGGIDVEGVESNVGFSQIITDIEQDDDEKFYQVNDPTDPEINQLLASDGGVLNLEGAGTIYDFVQLNNYLMVFAENGIWSISGVEGSSFDATSINVTRVSSTSSIGIGQYVDTPQGIFFLSINGVFLLAENQFGTPSIQDISTSTIQSKIAGLLKNRYNREGCSMVYDPMNSLVHLQFKDYYKEDLNGDHVSDADLRRSLVFDISSGTWTERERSIVGRKQVPHYTEAGLLIWDGISPWYGPALFDEFTTSSQDDGDNLIYLAIKPSTTDASDATLYEMTETAADHADFGENAYRCKVRLNPVVLTDPLTDKQISYLEVYAHNPKVIDAASCTVTTNYSWSSEPTGTPFEAIRYQQYPVQVHHADSDVLISREKVHGKGKAVDLQFENNDIDKSFKILGYAFTYNSSANV